MKEIRIDCAHQSEAELALAKEQAQLVFRLNHTMPMTDELLIVEKYKNKNGRD